MGRGGGTAGPCTLSRRASPASRLCMPRPPGECHKALAGKGHKLIQRINVRRTKQGRKGRRTGSVGRSAETDRGMTRGSRSKEDGEWARAGKQEVSRGNRGRAGNQAEASCQHDGDAKIEKKRGGTVSIMGHPGTGRRREGLGSRRREARRGRWRRAAEKVSSNSGALRSR